MVLNAWPQSPSQYGDVGFPDGGTLRGQTSKLWLLPDWTIVVLGMMVASCWVSWGVHGINEWVLLALTVAAALAMVRIQLLRPLQDEVANMRSENGRFQHYNGKLSNEVQSLRENNAEIQRSKEDLQEQCDGLRDLHSLLEAHASQNRCDVGHILREIRDTLAEQRKIQQDTLASEYRTCMLAETQYKSMLMNTFVVFLNGASGCSPPGRKKGHGGDVGLSRAEFAGFLAGLTDPPKELTFEAADLDEDGVVSLEDISEWATGRQLLEGLFPKRGGGSESRGSSPPRGRPSRGGGALVPACGLRGPAANSRPLPRREVGSLGQAVPSGPALQAGLRLNSPPSRESTGGSNVQPARPRRMASPRAQAHAGPNSWRPQGSGSSRAMVAIADVESGPREAATSPDRLRTPFWWSRKESFSTTASDSRSPSPRRGQ